MNRQQSVVETSSAIQVRLDGHLATNEAVGQPARRKSLFLVFGIRLTF